MTMRCSTPYLIVPVVLLISAAALAGELVTENGAPPGFVPTGPIVAPSPGTVTPVLDDALAPGPTGDPSAAAPDRSDLPALLQPPAATIPLSEQLARLPAELREEAVIDLELVSAATAHERVRAGTIAALWNQGRFEEAIEALKVFETDGITFALGIAWRTGLPAGTLGHGADVRIGSDTGARKTRLDFDAQTGHLFGLVQWGTTTGTSAWTLNMSTDDGATWNETYRWGSTIGVIDVDLGVVGDFAYIAYVSGGVYANEARLRRSLVSTGGSDFGYGYVTVLDAGMSTMEEVALATNAQDFDNRIYYVAIQVDGVLRYAWDVSTDGTTFTDESPEGVVDASGNLDATWNNESTCTDFLFVSYIDSGGDLHVRSKADPFWTDHEVELSVGVSRKTSISSWGPNIICAFEYPYAEGIGIRYRISYDCGGNWAPGTLARPDGLTTFGFFGPAVDARNGSGTAIIYEREMGEPDEVLYQTRRGFAPGVWTEPFPFNDYDVLTGTSTSICDMPADVPGLFEHGVTYLASTDYTPYFDCPYEVVLDVPVGDPGLVGLDLAIAANPFSERTTFRFSLPAAGRARLDVFDALGRHVATLLDREMEAGVHSARFVASGLGSGIYYGRLRFDGETRTERMILTR